MDTSDHNSKRTRVEPVFGWLTEHGGHEWPARLLTLADGLQVARDPGGLVAPAEYTRERQVPPSPRRLAWMIRNAERLAPRDGSRIDQYRRRVIENPGRATALESLDRGEPGRSIDRKLVLEGPTHADCLLECERAVIWIEGKRNDWLDYSTTWDVTRDQLARNAEAAWILARELGKQSYVLVCHEHPLKHHEELLLDGYRRGTWIGGWPHLAPDERALLSSCIGTLTWERIGREWPPIVSQLR